MKQGTSISLARAGRLPLLAASFCGLLAVHAHAQSATNFQPADAPQQAAAATAPEAAATTTEAPAAEAPATAAQAPGPAPTTPSRYVGEADLEAYIQTIASTFSINNDLTDAFGQYQDPSKRPVIKRTPKKSRNRLQPVQKTPFSDIVRLIKVTTVMPGEKRFLVGTRSIKLGDRFPIKFRGTDINVQVAAVTSRGVEFRNIDSGESGMIKLNLLPTGMTPGTDGISAPGMARDRANAPLNLETPGL